MKLIEENSSKTFLSLFLASALLAGFHAGPVKAQDDMLDDADEALSSDSLQMDDINLEGKLSPSERLRKRREKLEERNKVMVEKKIEDVRVKQEIALTNKLQDAFGKSLNNLNEDKVQVIQAAPVAPIAPQPVIAPPAPVIEAKIIEVNEVPVKEVRKSKVIPYFGAQSIKGDKIDFESKSSIGVSLETLVLPQLSAGIGIESTSLDITDVANNFLYNAGPINSTYYNAFGNGRKMSSSKTAINANTKYFLTVESKIKPFIGAALSYNRSNLKYEDSGNGYNNYGVNLGNEGYSSTAMGATAKLGAEVDFTETVGLNIDLSYAKTFSSGISSTANTTNNNPDQIRLQNITKSMEDSDITSISAGLVVRF